MSERRVKRTMAAKLNELKSTLTTTSLIPVLVTGIQCAQVLGAGDSPLKVLLHSPRRRAVAGFL
ncbi:hypothetical protein RLEG12_25505 [Rhizobium leguminosarum bv. trifolii CB782]|nr:hypothetical protein RLEG12_25505 [Rhizobium leguminosarum bv. trifolii CB782]